MKIMVRDELIALLEKLDVDGLNKLIKLVEHLVYNEETNTLECGCNLEVDGKQTVNDELIVDEYIHILMSSAYRGVIYNARTGATASMNVCCGSASSSAYLSTTATSSGAYGTIVYLNATGQDISNQGVRISGRGSLVVESSIITDSIEIAYNDEDFGFQTATFVITATADSKGTMTWRGVTLNDNSSCSYNLAGEINASNLTSSGDFMIEEGHLFDMGGTSLNETELQALKDLVAVA